MADGDVTRAQVDTIAERAAAGWSVKEMAAALALTVNQVRYQIRKLGLGDRHRRRPKRWTIEWADAIIRGEVALARGSRRTVQRAEAMVAEAD